MPPLVATEEIARLQKRLSQVAQGEAFLLQGGDCAESFHRSTPQHIEESLRALLQMAMVLTIRTKRSVIKVGRIAGQFGKSRTNRHETRGATTLPSYRGDIINGHEFTSEARTPDPGRMEQAYAHSLASLDVIRRFIQEGESESHRLHPFTPNALEDLYTSHEALLLNYEEALVRRNESGEYYASSAHMLWIGERTRALDGAHVEFARGIVNPIGLKCGPEITPDELIRLIDRLNPENIPGRLTLIPRLGVRKIVALLPHLIRRVEEEGRRVIWCCDPMHANTYTTAKGFKTRSFEDILAECREFFKIHETLGTIAGGVHFEFTGRDVIECTGGGQKIREEELHPGGYETLCDPRLNPSQALELVFELTKGA